MTTIQLRQSWPLLLLFIAAVMGIGFVVGLIAAPGAWFEQLRKPPFIGPDWVNSLIWVLLCIAFAVSGWRLWQIDPQSVETRLWLAILILSWWYSPIFFLARMPILALGILIILAIMMGTFVARTYRIDRTSSMLFVPCLLWILYAASITAAIVAMN